MSLQSTLADGRRWSVMERSKMVTGGNNRLVTIDLKADVLDLKVTTLDLNDVGRKKYR